MASRDLNDLDPVMHTKALLFEQEAKANGIEIIFVCTYRSNTEQQATYNQGRTTPGKIVTFAKAGQSLHNLRKDGKPASMAFDIVPISKGRAIWETTGELAHIWARLGEIGEGLSLQWGGKWSGAKFDAGHFQLNQQERGAK